MRELEKRDLKLHDLCLSYLKGYGNIGEVVNFVRSNYDIDKFEDLEMVYAIAQTFDGDIYDDDDKDTILDEVGFKFGPGGIYFGDKNNPIFKEEDFDWGSSDNLLRNIKRYNNSYALDKLPQDDGWKKDKEFLRTFNTPVKYMLDNITKDGYKLENPVIGSLDEVKAARERFKKLGYERPGNIFTVNKFGDTVYNDGSDSLDKINGWNLPKEYRKSYAKYKQPENQDDSVGNWVDNLVK